MFGLVNKVKKALRTLDKAKDAPLAKAICSGGVLMASADGNIDASEVDGLKAVLAGKDNMKAFSGEVESWIDDRALQITRSAYTGRLALNKDLEAVAGNKEQALEVLAAVMDVAYADGEFSEPEQVMADAIAKKLGVSLKDLG